MLKLLKLVKLLHAKPYVCVTGHCRQPVPRKKVLAFAHRILTLSPHRFLLLPPGAEKRLLERFGGLHQALWKSMRLFAMDVQGS